MAAAGAIPTLDVQAGAAAFAEDLPRVLQCLGAASLDELGWSMGGPLALFLPVQAVRAEKSDDYLLRLGFQAYRTWPPSAQFVNPATKVFDPAQDARFLPRLISDECRTHLTYGRPSGGSIQLICCSATLEFYQVAHGVEPRHVWNGKVTFLSTITAIRHAMANFYGGNWADGN